MRGKAARTVIAGAAVIATAMMVSGFNGCNSKTQTGGTGPSAATKTPVKPGSAETTTAPVVQPGKMVVTLYFSTPDADKLVAEKRSIAKTPAVASAIIRELIQGPKTVGLYPTIPRSVKLVGVKMKGQTAIVNLTNVRATGYGGTAAEMMIVYSIVDSLTELPSVKNVRFLVDGKRRDVLLDAFDVTDPVPRDESLIRK